MKDSESTTSQRLNLFKEAISKQTTIMKENITGEGLDIPLLGIREAARKLKPDQTIELFDDDDDVYKKSNLFQLSTSQVRTNTHTHFLAMNAIIFLGAH